MALSLRAPARDERNGRLRRRVAGAALAATLAAVAVLASAPPGAAQRPAPELNLVTFAGGAIDELLALTDGRALSVWATVDGRFVGYTVGAPAFANQPFIDAFPGGVLPEGTALVVVMPAGSAPLPAFLASGGAPASLPPPAGELMITAYTYAVERGDQASVTALSTPGARCTIRYTTPSGAVETVDGLEAQTADESGAVFWMWRIDERTSPGTARVTVSCGEQSVTETIEIE